MPTATDRVAIYRERPEQLMYDAGLFPDPWQVQLLRSKDLRAALLCSRQTGKSTGTAALAELVAVTEPGSTVTITAPTECQSIELVRKVLNLHNAIGRPVPLKREAVTCLEYANGSRVIALPGKESRMRSYTSTLFIADEAARIPDAVFHAASPTTAVSGGRTILLSTAFSKSGHFFSEWNSEEPYLRLSVTAFDCPRIPREFLESERRRLGERWFNMEYMNAFADDVDGVFDMIAVRQALNPDLAPLFPSEVLP